MPWRPRRRAFARSVGRWPWRYIRLVRFIWFLVGLRHGLLHTSGRKTYSAVRAAAKGYSFGRGGGFGGGVGFTFDGGGFVFPWWFLRMVCGGGGFEPFPC